MKRFFRTLLAALALSFPSFSRGKNNAAEKAAEPDLAEETKLARLGSLEAVDKTYGRTIAGGPGSQKIGDTFDALPQDVKDAFYAARKGKIRQATAVIDDEQHSDPYAWKTDRLTRGVNAAVARRGAFRK